MKKLFSNKYFRISFYIIGGMFLGWLIFHSPKKNEEKNNTVSEAVKAAIWTCAMHPQIRMDAPGKCPICGMDLIQLNQSGVTTDPGAIYLTDEAAQLANVLTSIVTRQSPVKEVRLYGKVQTDERLLQSQVSYLPGRIEKLFVNFTGEKVRKGQTLAVIYSPELITAQQELIETKSTKQIQPVLYEAAKEKLRQWKLTENQITSIENSGKVKNDFEIFANTTGIVSAKRVNNGDYISPGSVLFDVADLSQVWIMFDAYESDIPFLSTGQKVTFNIQALPDVNFSGEIAFIDPVLNPITRVAKVRVEISNPDGKLKPEMFATGIVKANLNQYKDKIVIPRTAVLWTGKRSIVYVKQKENTYLGFKIREVELGPMLGNSYVVESGLTEGEEIVTQGAFSVDASAQLEGKPSMLNQVEDEKRTMPETENTISDNNKNKGQEVKINSNEKLNVNIDFTKQLNVVYEQYIVLKNAFVLSDPMKTKPAAQKIQQVLAKVNSKLLQGNAGKQWMNISGNMDKQIKLISNSDKIEDQRAAFSGLSDQFYKAIKTFGLVGETAYFQFCPMVNHNKGAYWLSESKIIRNPYFGNKMIDCGETKDALKY